MNLSTSERFLDEPRLLHFPVASQRIDPDAAKVVRRLTQAGFKAYLVGGCVRDLLLDKAPKDFDVATSAKPNEVRGLFRNCRIIGRRFRLAHILCGGNKVIEVATFRKDPTADILEDTAEWEPADESDDAPRKARPNDDQDLLIRHDNVFGTPPEDAIRRDFTMNALFYDLERKEVVDYVGGLADIEARVIRTIGDADVRFREDPVRILRVIKFAARLDLGIEPQVYDAMVAHREDLLRAARPRLLEELLRLMRHAAARRAVWIAWETGVLATVLPEVSAWIDDHPDASARLWSRLAAIDARQKAGEMPSDATLFCALTLDPALESMTGVKDALNGATDFYQDLQALLPMPRRLFDRVRQVVAAQRRFRTGRESTLTRRDFYEDAHDLFVLDGSHVRPPKETARRVTSGV